MSSVYAHWLDGEVLLLNSISTKRTRPSVDKDAGRHLKLLALMGESFCLSDAQLIDSSAVLRQFEDDAFRGFLRSNPGFLKLVAQSKVERPSNLDLAMAAFYRALNPNWDSAIFGGNAITLRMGEVIKSAGSDPIALLNKRNPNGIQPLVNEFPQFGKYLRGLVLAVHEFATASIERCSGIPRTTKLTSLLDVLQEAQDAPHTAPEYEQIVEETLAFIRRAVPDPAAQHRRSDILAQLGDRSDSPKYSKIWHTIVNAWNVAVQRTVSPAGSVAYLSKHAAPVGLMVDREAGALLPLSEVVNAPWLSADRVVGSIDKDPSRLSWGRVNELWNETTGTRETLVAARLTGSIEAMSEALRNHIRTINRKLVPWTVPSIALVGIIGGLVFTIGGKIALPATVITGAAQAVSVGTRVICLRIRFAAYWQSAL